MRAKFGSLLFVVVAIVVFSAAVAVTDEPMFVRWLVMDDPGDETIRDYWERAEREELDPPAMVDLGTMLFIAAIPKTPCGFSKMPSISIPISMRRGSESAWWSTAREI